MIDFFDVKYSEEYTTLHLKDCKELFKTHICIYDMSSTQLIACVPINCHVDFTDRYNISINNVSYNLFTSKFYYFDSENPVYKKIIDKQYVLFCCKDDIVQFQKFMIENGIENYDILQKYKQTKRNSFSIKVDVLQFQKFSALYHIMNLEKAQEINLVCDIKGWSWDNSDKTKFVGVKVKYTSGKKKYFMEHVRYGYIPTKKSEFEYIDNYIAFMTSLSQFIKTNFS